MEEREGRGVKERIFSLLAHGLKSSATGQTVTATGQTGDHPLSGQ
jgi:hypothetical protein